MNYDSFAEGWAGKPVPCSSPEANDAPALRDTLARAFASAANGTPGLVVLPYGVGRALEPTAGRARAGARTETFALDDATRVRGMGDAPSTGPFTLGPMRSRTGRARFEGAVTRAIGLIHAGDCYQVNLSHALEGTFAGDARALAAALFARARPAHGAYVEHDLGDGRRRVVISLSPELFLSVSREGERSLRVLTRPMKGTRAEGGAAELERSAKDRAELAMIVDLMRNDLGRTCAIGSVRVDAERAIEHHAAGVVQGTWGVSGMLDFGGTPRGAGERVGELVAGAFPPGSVTGAPKVRAMQIIDELEDEDRGVYCGSIGLIEPDGNGCARAILNVAIRTLVIEGEGDPRDMGSFVRARAEYRVGAGIVADSDPGEEWRETLVKASVLRHVTTIEDGA
jgi:anthranilate/para-aminobenzoate synthase component I